MIRKESLRKYGLVLLLALLIALSPVNVAVAEQNRCLPDWDTDTPVLIDKGISRTFADEPNGLKSAREVNIVIMGKSPLPKITINNDRAESFRRFSVNLTGKAYGSKNFIRACSFLLRDEKNNIVDTRETQTVFGKALPLAWLTPKNAGIYQITAICVDSHGTTGTENKIIAVALSNDKRNTPLLIVNKTLNCYIGNCRVDFSKTNNFGKSLSVRYYDITAGDNRKVQAIPCGDKICKLGLTRPGAYTVKLEARFIFGSNANGFIYSDKGEAIIQVFVGQNISGVAVPKTAIPIATARPTYRQPVKPIATTTPTATTATIANNIDIDCMGPGCSGKQSPMLGVGGFAAIFALVILAQKNKK